VENDGNWLSPTMSCTKTVVFFSMNKPILAGRLVIEVFFHDFGPFPSHTKSSFLN